MAINTWPSSPASNSHRGASFVETVLLNVPFASSSSPECQLDGIMPHSYVTSDTCSWKCIGDGFASQEGVNCCQQGEDYAAMGQLFHIFPPGLVCLGAQIPCHRYGDRAAIGACVTHTVLLLILQVKTCDMSNQLILSARLPCVTKVQVETRILKQCAP